MEERLQQLEILVARLTEESAATKAENQLLKTENRLLHLKVQTLLKKLFGAKTEKMSPDQLELALSELAQIVVEEERPTPPEPTPPRPRGPRPEKKTRLPADLPTERVYIDPEEVKQNPEAYQCIGAEETEELDVVPQQYFRRLIIRNKYKRVDDRTQAPVLAPLPPRLIEHSLASVGLVTDVIIHKYVDHLPLFRQSQIFLRNGIVLSDKTLGDWIGKGAWWLDPIYQQIRKELIECNYLQVDETPVRYCHAEEGGSRLGYLWGYHSPGGMLLFEWHTGRGADCLDATLRDFRGRVQCDGYIAYTSYAADHKAIELFGCWAHGRRKFVDALKEEPRLAAWVIHQIGQLYTVEAEMRTAGPALRQAARSARSKMTLARLKRVLTRWAKRFLPESFMGKAVSYAIAQWSRLETYVEDGILMIDNNGIENAIRPSAIGKKNWLFVGHPEAGDRAAVMYTLLANCRRLGINPRDYLRDVLSRLPSMTNQDSIAELTPAAWAAARMPKKAARAA